MKPIPSCPEYFACEDGHIWRGGEQLRERIYGRANGRGFYPTLAVSIDGKLIKKYVHRLVCEAYHGPCPPGMQCRHLDGSRSNNNPGNLRWGTTAENIADRQKHKFNGGEKNPCATLTETQVRDFRYLRSLGFSGGWIAQAFGFNVRMINAAISGRTWKHLDRNPERQERRA